jgi:uncharacterized protein (TIGR02147 family)
LLQKEKSIYNFSNYKEYLMSRVGHPGQRKGIKSLLAKALQCQPTYVSQVFNGNADFSAEQADIINRFFGHSRDESIFFLLLIQKNRAGTRSLKEFVQVQINELLAKRMEISERIGQSAALTQEQQSTYYSSWHFAAIHVALTVPQLRTKESIGRYLRIPVKKIAEVLKFLLETGLIQTNGLEYSTTPMQIHLGNDSHNITKHHSHWRQQALESLERAELTDLHYSTVVSLSREDALQIRERILEEIKTNQAIIKDSLEEELFAYTLDFFSMRR